MQLLNMWFNIVPFYDVALYPFKKYNALAFHYIVYYEKGLLSLNYYFTHVESVLLCLHNFNTNLFEYMLGLYVNIYYVKSSWV